MVFDGVELQRRGPAVVRAGMSMGMRRGVIVAACLLLSLPALQAQMLTGKVVGVSDGDTVTLLDRSKTQHRIRLLGIDAPESAQSFGQVSRKHLADQVFGKEIQADCPKSDHYGRRLCKLIIQGRDVNLGMVKAGLAWHYRQYQSDQAPQDRGLYAAAQEAARQARVGLWSEAQPMAPWDYRRAGRSASQQGKAQAAAAAPQAAPARAAGAGAASDPVKLSRSGICHDVGSPHYDRTTNFTPHSTMQACVAAGGRPSEGSGR
jgi:endonuclease YncB( thermonuclease family)